MTSEIIDYSQFVEKSWNKSVKEFLLLSKLSRVHSFKISKSKKKKVLLMFIDPLKMYSHYIF